MSIEIIYNDRDNRNDLLLSDDSSGTMTVSDLTNVTRILLQIGGVTLDSDTDPGYFDWATDGAEGKLYLTLGDASLVEGHFLGSLIIFDPTHTDGLFWGTVEFEVVSNFGG